MSSFYNRRILAEGINLFNVLKFSFDYWLNL